MTALLDYGLPGRGTEAPQRGGASSSLCPFLTWTVTRQGSATLKTHGQVPGFREPTAFFAHGKNKQGGGALPWCGGLDWTAGVGKTQRANSHAHTHAHSLH